MTKEEIDAILDDLVTLWSGTYSERRQARLQLASTLQAERESEREACAKVCSERAMAAVDANEPQAVIDAIDDVSMAIRARK